MNSSAAATSQGASLARFRKRRYLTLAGVFHFAITGAVYLLGHGRLLPAQFDGNGAASFASDSPVYLADALTLVKQLRQFDIAAWANAPFPLHTKLYSLCLTALGPLVGYNILAAEPLNLICYLAIVVLVFKLGSEISDARTGLLAAMVVAVWPTFLLHTTQLLKDPLCIALLLALILFACRALNRSFDVIQGVGTGLLAGASTVLLWLARQNQGELILLIVSLCVAFQCLRFLQLRKVSTGNLAGCVLLAVISVATPVLGPRLLAPYRNPRPHPLLSGNTNTLTSEPVKTLPVPEPSRKSPPLTRLREQIAWARYLFATYPGASSNIDQDVRLDSWRAVISYLPRAAVIGLFAPFPSLWFTAGAQVGRLGRILSGCETLIMYVVMLLAFRGLWEKRCHLANWLLVVIAFCAILILGLVTTNIGALYRMRYPFWILLIIPGVDSAVRAARTTSSGKLQER